MSSAPRTRYQSWVWWVCGLLLCASAINYMDRQTLANASVRITKEFQLKEEQYGELEAGFSYAFMVGSIVFGLLADKLPVRWLYALVLTSWSAVGFATAYCRDFHGLLACRVMLGFFEAGHWPCAVKAVKTFLDPSRRALGNSVVQSGTSIGAVVTPLIMFSLMTKDLGTWRLPFQVIGAMGLLWLVAWLCLVRDGDLKTIPETKQNGQVRPWWEILFTRRMAVILAVVSLINTSWQLLRAWLPKFLQKGRGYTESEQLFFSSAWYLFTDLGCLGAGAAALWLSRKGLALASARTLTFSTCALCGMSMLAVPHLEKGPILLCVLLLAGAGILGLFPLYHAFSQDISGAHQGKVTGIAGVAAFAFSAQANIWFGKSIDATKSYDKGLALIGCLPILAALILWLFWGRDPETKPIQAT